MPIIFISGYGDVPKTVRAMKAGAVEFLTKPLNDDDLLSAIRQAIERSRSTLAQQSEMRQLRQCVTSLTPREREVMDLVVSGLLNKQVGAELGISEITVKAHRGKVMEKMQAESIADLVRMAERLSSATAPGYQPGNSPEVATRFAENVTDGCEKTVCVKTAAVTREIAVIVGDAPDALQLSLPVVIRIDLVDQHSAVLSTMTGQIALRVAIDIESSHQASSLDRLLPHRRVNRLTTPCDLSGVSHVD